MADEMGAKHSPHVRALGNDTWHLALDTWHLALGTWHSALGIWHLALGTWHVALGTWHLAPEPSVHHLMNRNLMWNMTTNMSNIMLFLTCLRNHKKHPGASRLTLRCLWWLQDITWMVLSRLWWHWFLIFFYTFAEQTTTQTCKCFNRSRRLRKPHSNHRKEHQQR